MKREMLPMVINNFFFKYFQFVLDVHCAVHAACFFGFDALFQRFVSATG